MKDVLWSVVTEPQLMAVCIVLSQVIAIARRGCDRPERTALAFTSCVKTSI